MKFSAQYPVVNKKKNKWIWQNFKPKPNGNGKVPENNAANEGRMGELPDPWTGWVRPVFSVNWDYNNVDLSYYLYVYLIIFKCYMIKVFEPKDIYICSMANSGQ